VNHASQVATMSDGLCAASLLKESFFYDLHSDSSAVNAKRKVIIPTSATKAI